MTTAFRPLTTSFGRLLIDYDERVLRPRPWTAAQSVWAAELLHDAPPGPVLELCAGAGQIGLLALALAGSDRDLVLVDSSPAACGYARINAARAQLSGAVDVRAATLQAALAPGERFAVIVADPPWVPTGAVERFPEDPRPAIDGGPDGLTVAWACLDVIGRHLLPGGSAVVQLGSVAQVDRVAARLAHAAARRDPEELGGTERAEEPPGSTEPGGTEPGSTEPGGTEPGSAEAGSAEAGSAKAGSAEPGGDRRSGAPGEARAGVLAHLTVDGVRSYGERGVLVRLRCR